MLFSTKNYLKSQSLNQFMYPYATDVQLNLVYGCPQDC